MKEMNKVIENELEKWNSVEDKTIEDHDFYNDVKDTIKKILFIDKDEINGINELREEVEKLKNK